MADVNERQLLRELVLTIFPWLARIGLSATGALAIKSAAAKTELEGGGPAVLRVGDVRGLVFDPGIPGTTAPALFYTADGGATFVKVAQVAAGSTGGGATPPPASTPFTALAPTGSSKVTCG